jgi:hypothetical protein
MTSRDLGPQVIAVGNPPQNASHTLRSPFAVLGNTED